MHQKTWIAYVPLVPSRLMDFLEAAAVRDRDARQAWMVSETRDSCCAKYKQIFVLRMPSHPVLAMRHSRDPVLMHCSQGIRPVKVQ